MPHWNAEIPIAETPDLLKECRGNRKCVRERIIDATPQGVSLRAISFRQNGKTALVTLEGQEAPVRQFFKDVLDTDDPDGPFETSGE